MLEKAISAFLLRRREAKVRFELYLSGKRQNRANSNAIYEQIRNLLNEIQLEKMKKYDRHKYGFSSCLYILELSSLSNSPCFSPLLLLKQLQKFGAKRELLARINCHQNAFEMITTEGKVLRLGKGLP
jgi:hypothetical protein